MIGYNVKDNGYGGKVLELSNDDTKTARTVNFAFLIPEEKINTLMYLVVMIGIQKSPLNTRLAPVSNSFIIDKSKVSPLSANIPRPLFNTL